MLSLFANLWNKIQLLVLSDIPFINGSALAEKPFQPDLR